MNTDISKGIMVHIADTREFCRQIERKGDRAGPRRLVREGPVTKSGCCIYTPPVR